MKEEIIIIRDTLEDKIEIDMIVIEKVIIAISRRNIMTEKTDIMVEEIKIDLQKEKMILEWSIKIEKIDRKDNLLDKIEMKELKKSIEILKSKEIINQFKIYIKL